MSFIVSAKLKKAADACARLVSPRVVAFCVMAVCLIFTLAVTAANLHLAETVRTEQTPAIRATALAASDNTGIYYTAFSGDLASLELDRVFAVTIEVDGEERTVQMLIGTVADALERAGITLEGDDYTEPSLDTAVTLGSRVIVHRVEYQDRVETQAIPYETAYVYTSLYFRDPKRSTTLQTGADGQKTVTTRERWVDGELENSIVINETTDVEPVDHIVKTYGAGAPVSSLTGPDGTTNAPASYSRVLTGKATGYYSRGGRGSSGLGLGYGTVAVDPRVIPYGTLLYITSTDGSFVYGYAIATDTGIALRNGTILVDLFYETYAESVLNGAIQVNVYVVS